MYAGLRVLRWRNSSFRGRIRSVSLLFFLSLVLVVDCSKNADSFSLIRSSYNGTVLSHLSSGESIDPNDTDSAHHPSKSPRSSSSRLVEVYEHEFYSKSKQMWIGGVGTSRSNTVVSRWSSTSIPNDKLKHLPPPSELSSPKGYIYEGEWMIDMTSESKDELGWEYYLDETSEEKIGRRRRRWLRVVVKIPSPAEDQQEQEQQRHYRNMESPATKEIPRVSAYSPFFKRHFFLRSFRDSFNFKGYGLSLSKSLIYPSFAFTLRMPITTHFDIFEMRPYIPSIATSMSFSFRPYKIVLNLNCSLPLEVAKTIWWIILDWTMWSFKIALSLIETISIDLIWKLGCIGFLGKVFDFGRWLTETKTHLNGDINSTTQETFQAKERLKAEDVVLISRHGATILGRQYPRIPSRRSIIYSQNTVQRLGVTAAMHLSQEKGLKFRWSWWNTYFSTVEFYQSLFQSWLRGFTLPTIPAPRPIHRYLLDLQERDSLREVNARLMKALFGIIWGGFTPEAPYYSCTAMLSMSGFYGIYGGESIKRYLMRTKHAVDPFDSGVSSNIIYKSMEETNTSEQSRNETYGENVEIEESDTTRKIAK